MSLEPLLHTILVPGPARTYDTPAAWWRDHHAATSAFARPIDRAIVGATRVDVLGFAFAGGYRAALQSMVPALPDDRLASFAATEEQGAHPRSLRTTLAPAEDGGFVLDGEKRWVTLGPDGGEILVVARLAEPAAERPTLRVVRVEAQAPGVTITPLPHAAFVPEIPHASVRLEHVRVAPSAILAGDGYDAYLKPFRTIEDVHVHAALWAWLAATGVRHGFPRDLVARAAALVVGARALADTSPSDASVHVALGGIVEESKVLAAAFESAWSLAPTDARARWERDRVILGVAGKARAQRFEKAWESLRRV